jgi:hypothetical protein
MSVLYIDSMPFIDEDAVILAGVPAMVRVKILNMKIEAAKKSVVDYVESRSFSYTF